MPAITLTINNELFSARKEQTILEIAREHGIDIPTLCHFEGLEAMGGCRLCLVELQGSPGCAANSVAMSGRVASSAARCVARRWVTGHW